MLGVGTNIYSVLYIFAALVLLIFAIIFLVKAWRKYIDFIKTVNSVKVKKEIKTSKEGDKIASSWVNPLITTLAVIFGYVVIVTLGWNLMQSVTTNISAYKSTAEISEQKKVQESVLPSPEEFDQKRAQQKDRAEVKPHEKALDSFYKNMESEAQKIRQRSLGESTVPTTKDSIGKK